MTPRDPNPEPLVRIDDPAFARIMEYVLGVLPHERRTYFAVLDAPGSTVAELADDLGRDRSTINRALSTLEEKNLVDRKRQILPAGGYVYQYFPTPIADAETMMHEAVDRWASDIHARIDAFDA